MTPLSIQPSWNWERYPCPVCGEQAIVYDGSVKWRSGDRPPRSLATKKELGFSPRADYELAHYFHCAHCGTPLVDFLDDRYEPHFRVERQSPAS